MNFEKFWGDIEEQTVFTHCIVCNKRIKKTKVTEKYSKSGKKYSYLATTNKKFCKKHRRFGQKVKEKERKDKKAQEAGFTSYENYLVSLKVLKNENC